MSLRQSKQKQPRREDKVVKAERKLEDDVFDHPALFAINKLRKKGLFETVDYCIAKGKEANVYRGTTKDGGFVAIKIYRLHATSFVHMQKYLQGDRRFEKSSHSQFGVIFTWTRKEFANLELMRSAGVRVPVALGFWRNILVMEFLGEKGVPFSTLSETGSENPNEDCEKIISDLELLWKAGMVHADLSEYNIMMTDSGPYFIDCGQSVLSTHPNAQEFYERDKANILHYFSKYENFSISP